MLEALLPYRHIDYQTDLTTDEIGQRLTENVITGFSLYSKKLYYGGYTPYSFSVRKTSSNFKPQGVSPNVDGTYRISNGKMRVTLSLRPHTIWFIVLFVLGFPSVFFVVLAIPEFFKTGDIGIVLNGLFPALVVYGIFWIIFQMQSSSAIRFWEHTLQLQKTQV